MVQSTDISVKMGNEKWFDEINAKPEALVSVKFLKGTIVGNWGYDVGQVAKFPGSKAKQLIANGRAQPFTKPKESGWKKPESFRKPGRKPGRRSVRY